LIRQIGGRINIIVQLFKIIGGHRVRNPGPIKTIGIVRAAWTQRFAEKLTLLDHQRSAATTAVRERIHAAYFRVYGSCKNN
jgi:hypothetical protein